MKITVTAEDITNGKAHSCTDCPIALAIRRLVGPDITVCVSCLRARIGDGQTMLGPEGTQFVLAFDAGKPVKPFQFELAE